MLGRFGDTGVPGIEQDERRRCGLWPAVACARCGRIVGIDVPHGRAGNLLGVGLATGSPGCCTLLEDAAVGVEICTRGGSYRARGSAAGPMERSTAAGAAWPGGHRDSARRLISCRSQPYNDGRDASQTATHVIGPGQRVAHRAGANPPARFHGACRGGGLPLCEAISPGPLGHRSRLLPDPGLSCCRSPADVEFI